MAFSVTRTRVPLGNRIGVICEITGDGSTRAFETGLSRVDFAVLATGNGSATNWTTDGVYYNYSDGGTTQANGYIYLGFAPADGEKIWAFAIGLG